MGMRINKILWPLTALLVVGLNTQVSVAKSSDDNDETLVVEATAEQVLKQQPGVSIITSEDIKKNPPVNDLSDIIRKMPGVNLFRWHPVGVAAGITLPTPAITHGVARRHRYTIN